MRANVRCEKNEVNKAIADVDQALKLKPDLPVALAAAPVLLQSGRLDDAVPT